MRTETERKGYRPTTVHTYSTIAKPIIAEIGNIRMADITSYHVDRALYSTKSGSKISAERRWTVFRLVLNHATKRKVIDSNPLSFMDAPRAKPQKETRCLTVQELALLIQTAEKFGLMETEIKTLAATGLRTGEMRALKWSDLNPGIPALYVSKTVYQVSGEIGVGPTKTKNSNRSVEISEPLLRELDVHRARQETQAILSPIVNAGRLGMVARVDEGLMFPSRSGRLWGQDDFNIRLRKVANRSGISNPETITAHVFRHTHCTLALANGMDIFHLSRRVGHATIAITADRYGRLTINSQTKGATVIDSLLEAKNG